MNTQIITIAGFKVCMIYKSYEWKVSEETRLRTKVLQEGGEALFTDDFISQHKLSELYGGETYFVAQER